MTRWLKPLILILIISLNNNGFAQRRNADTNHQLGRFTLNKSLFFNYDLFSLTSQESDSSKLLLSITLVNDLLQFIKYSDSVYAAKFELSVSIFRENGSLYQAQTFRKDLQVNNFSDTNSRSIDHSYFQIFDLPHGIYNVILELTDLDTRLSLKRETEVVIKNFNDQPITIQDPIFLLSGGSSDKYSPLDNVKTNFFTRFSKKPVKFVSPFNIDDLPHYRFTDPVVLYHEIYQKEKGDSLEINYRIIDKNNELKWEQNFNLFSATARTFTQKIKLDPQKFQPGFYILQIFAKNERSVQKHQTRFYFNRKIKPNLTKLDSSEAVDEFGPLEYITNGKEYDLLKMLSSSDLDSAINQFWADRNPSENNSDNKLHDEFLNRIRFANQNFVSLVFNKRGWETDQGRIYLIYGSPDDIMHPQSPNTEYQHEVWIYNYPKPDQRFIFIFKPEKGEYVLLRGG